MQEHASTSFAQGTVDYLGFTIDRDGFHKNWKLLTTQLYNEALAIIVFYVHT